MEHKRLRKHLIWTFIIFFLFSCIIYVTSTVPFVKGIYAIIEKEAIPLLLIFRPTRSSQLDKENRNATHEHVDYDRIEKENIALRSQFQTTYPKPAILLPARIVGMKSFIPGISLPESLILDKGGKDQVQVEDIVVFENFLLGKIEKVSSHLSLVRLITVSDDSITAKTVRTNALGLIKAKSQGGMIFDNVLLSEKLEVSDTVVAKGDVDISGKGVPPDLIIGKIVSIDRKASDLFQTAKVESMIDVTKLSIVFIIR